MGDEIEDFDGYLEMQGFGEYADVLRDYESLIRERLQTKNVDPKTTLAGALYDAKRGEMTQSEVAVLAETTEVSIRDARKAMGLHTEEDLDVLMKVVPFEQAPLLDRYANDTLGEPPEAVAAVIHSQILGKPLEITAEYFEVSEEEVERAESWLKETKDEEELTLDAVRRHLDEVRKESSAFRELLEKS